MTECDGAYLERWFPGSCVRQVQHQASLKTGSRLPAPTASMMSCRCSLSGRVLGLRYREIERMSRGERWRTSGDAIAAEHDDIQCPRSTVGGKHARGVGLGTRTSWGSSDAPGVCVSISSRQDVRHWVDAWVCCAWVCCAQDAGGYDRVLIRFEFRSQSGIKVEAVTLDSRLEEDPLAYKGTMHLQDSCVARLSRHRCRMEMLSQQSVLDLSVVVSDFTK